MKAHVSAEKKHEVAHIAKKLKEYPIIGLVDLERLPSPQLAIMRKQLRGEVELIMTKKRLFKIAVDHIKAEKPGIEKLLPYLSGIPAVLFAKENPFKLHKMLQKSKSPAPAKAGQKAPRDIIVPAGPTPFAPGPVISELGKVGIKATIDQGKVVIKADSTVVREGGEISEALASILLRLNIQPMEIGLNLVAVYEHGMVFESKLLAVDETEYLNNLAQGHRWAINLAVEAGIVNSTTVRVMLTKAVQNSRAVAIESGILADEVKNQVLSKAEQQATALQQELKI